MAGAVQGRGAAQLGSVCSRKAALGRDGRKKSAGEGARGGRWSAGGPEHLGFPEPELGRHLHGGPAKNSSLSSTQE